ncbi:SDR family oxidoreductase [Candidatus Woesearchaeota archaeon]|nr:SDR family oxidoreductase [Candidatus Woesearchaeota archaeon]
MDFGLQGKKALVTGAGRGIGASIAVNLAREGVKVAVVSRTEPDLKKVVEDMGGAGNGHFMLAADLTEEGGPGKAFGGIVKRFGAPDILVNNLGDTLELRDPFIPVREWRKMFRLNLEVAIELNNLVIPQMERNKWGRIVNVLSIASFENSGPVPYCTVKAAFAAYTRSMGRVLAKTGIVMSGVAPGAIFTKGGAWDIALKERPEHVRKYLEDRCPLGKFGEPGDIGAMVAVLCSEQAKFCQGSIFPVDGGQSRHYFQAITD